MKELHCSNRAYLGGLKHIGTSNSLSPRNSAAYNPQTQNPEYSSSLLA